MPACWVFGAAACVRGKKLTKLFELLGQNLLLRTAFFYRRIF